MKTYYDQRKEDGPAGLGIILIIVGLVLLALNFHWIPFEIKSWLISWQMLLIVLGIIIVATKDDKTGGLILLFIGGFFLAREHFFEFYEIKKWFFPSLIIFIGLIFLFKSPEKRRIRSRRHFNKTDHIK